MAQQGEHEKHLNKQDKIYSKLFVGHVPHVVSGSVSAKVPLAKMCRSHRVDLRGQDGDIRELLDYRFGS